MPQNSLYFGAGGEVKLRPAHSRWAIALDSAGQFAPRNTRSSLRFASAQKRERSAFLLAEALVGCAVVGLLVVALCLLMGRFRTDLSTLESRGALLDDAAPTSPPVNPAGEAVQEGAKKLKGLLGF